MGRQIKYMGSADIRTVPKGANFGGQLKDEDAVEKDVVFSKDNYWVVDADEAGLTDEQVELLLEDKDSFKDVTDSKRVPTNAHQSTFLGMKSVSADETNLVTTAGSATDSPTGTTTTGGSTSGTSTGGSTGGSTKGSGKAS